MYDPVEVHKLFVHREDVMLHFSDRVAAECGVRELTTHAINALQMITPVAN